MKKLFYLLVITFFFIGCKKSNQLEEIQILTYFSNAKEYLYYSNINKNGFVETLHNSETLKKENYCQTRVSKNLLDSIVKICENKDDKYFIFKSLDRTRYCGLWQSVKIIFENGKIIIFKFPYANNENKQFMTFQTLAKQIQNDSFKSKRIDIIQYTNLQFKQLDLSKITYKRDSILIVNELIKSKSNY